MISAPKNVYGPDIFKMFVNELGGPKRVCKMLDVIERTVWRWLAEDSVPKMAVRALYWETQYGRSLIDTDHHNEVILMRGRIHLLEEQFARASRVIAGLKLLNFGTANEPYFDELGEFSEREQVADQSSNVHVENHSNLSAKERARKDERLKRETEMSHLSIDEYAKKAHRVAKQRETQQKRLARG